MAVQSRLDLGRRFCGPKFCSKIRARDAVPPDGFMANSTLFIVDGDPRDLRALAEVSTALEGRAVLSEAGAAFSLLLVSRDLRDEDLFAFLCHAHKLHPGAKRVL